MSLPLAKARGNDRGAPRHEARPPCASSGGQAGFSDRDACRRSTPIGSASAPAEPALTAGAVLALQYGVGVAADEHVRTEKAGAGDEDAEGVRARADRRGQRHAPPRTSWLLSREPSTSLSGRQVRAASKPGSSAIRSTSRL